MHYLVILAMGVAVGIEGPFWFSVLFKYLQNRKILKEITPTHVKEEKLCKGPHSWMMAPSFSDQGNSEIRVCQVCGFIPEMDKMASMEAVDRIEENNRIRALEKKVLHEFVAREDEDIKKYFDAEIKNGVSFEKLTHIHGAGMTFNTRFHIYKSGKKEEIERALKKSDA